MIRSFQDPLSGAWIVCMLCTPDKRDRWLIRKGFKKQPRRLVGEFLHLSRNEGAENMFIIWISDALSGISLQSTLAHEALHLALGLQRFMNCADEDEDEDADMKIPSSMEETFCYHYSSLYERIARLLLKH